MARNRINGSELARQLGWSQPYVSRRLNGATAFDMDDLEAVASVLGVPVNALLPRLDSNQ